MATMAVPSPLYGRVCDPRLGNSVKYHSLHEMITDPET
jgi:hypothetical protein